VPLRTTSMPSPFLGELCTALRHVEIAEQRGERSAWAKRLITSRPAKVCAFSLRLAF